MRAETLAFARLWPDMPKRKFQIDLRANNGRFQPPPFVIRR